MEDGDGSVGRDRHTSRYQPRTRPRTYQHIATLYTLEGEVYQYEVMEHALVWQMSYTRTTTCPMAVWAAHGWWETR